MSVRVTWATALRVLRQLRRDPRTIALMLIVPSLLLALFKYVFEGQEETFNRVGGPLVGLFPFVIMFLITSITMLRERTTGTLERLMTLPLSKLDLLVIALAIANGLLGMSMGLFLSAFATTEFQVVQFMPAFILPQILVCGLFQPRDEMAPALEAVSDVLPLTYAFDALLRAAGSGALGSRFTLDVVVIAGSTVLALVLGAATLRRRTP